MIYENRKKQNREEQNRKERDKKERDKKESIHNGKEKSRIGHRFALDIDECRFGCDWNQHLG